MTRDCAAAAEAAAGRSNALHWAVPLHEEPGPRADVIIDATTRRDGVAVVAGRRSLAGGMPGSVAFDVLAHACCPSPWSPPTEFRECRAGAHSAYPAIDLRPAARPRWGCHLTHNPIVSDYAT